MKSYTKFKHFHSRKFIWKYRLGDGGLNVLMTTNRRIMCQLLYFINVAYGYFDKMQVRLLNLPETGHPTPECIIVLIALSYLMYCLVFTQSCYNHRSATITYVYFLWNLAFVTHVTHGTIVVILACKYIKHRDRAPLVECLSDYKWNEILRLIFIAIR